MNQQQVPGGATPGGGNGAGPFQEQRQSAAPNVLHRADTAQPTGYPPQQQIQNAHSQIAPQNVQRSQTTVAAANGKGQAPEDDQEEDESSSDDDYYDEEEEEEKEGKAADGQDQAQVTAQSREGQDNRPQQQQPQ